MKNSNMVVSRPQDILKTWIPFKKAIGVTSVHTEEEYARATATIEMLLDEIDDNGDHPLADVLDYLADQVKVYENEQFIIPKSGAARRVALSDGAARITTGRFG